MFVTPGVVVDGKLVTTDLVDINLEHPHPAGQLVLRRLGDTGETFVKTGSAGQSGRQAASLEPDHHAAAAEARLQRTSTPGSCRRAGIDKRTGDYLALDTGGGPIARFWSTALAGLVDIGYVKATGHSVKIYLPKTATLPEVEFEWKIPKWSNAIERDRARTYFQAYAAAARSALLPSRR